MFPLYEIIFAAFAFILGASIGSFLNVCIYRMPRGLSVNEPKRSFCPNCKYQIPLYHNIPLFTWLFLRGKCANCGSRISFRYFGVELLTGLLFLAVWLKVWAWGRPDWPPQPWILALPFWIFGAMLVVATFIDFEFFIIPDEITIWGTAAGVILSFAIPTLQNETSNLAAAFWSMVGAGVGFVALWLVVELGKKAFGKKHFKPSSTLPFSWRRRVVVSPEGKEESDADLVVGDVSWKDAPRPGLGQRLGETFHWLLETMKLAKKKDDLGEAWVWSDIFGFARDGDRLVMKCPQASVDGSEFTDAELIFELDHLTIGGRKWMLEKTDVIEGTLSSLIIPREAMGFGDVKFIACIGAFLGWKAVAFTIMSASAIGAVFGILAMALGRREWSMKIPFGPYLALGALIWLFTGPELVNWYWAFTQPTGN